MFIPYFGGVVKKVICVHADSRRLAKMAEKSVSFFFAGEPFLTFSSEVVQFLETCHAGESRGALVKNHLLLSFWLSGGSPGLVLRGNSCQGQGCLVLRSKPRACGLVGDIR